MSAAGDALPVGNGTRRRGLALMLVVFVLGLVCGAALSVIVIRSVMPDRPWIGSRAVGLGPGGPGFERMAERLGLTDEQRRLVHAELENTRREVHRLVRESGDRIRAVLDEDQARRFEEMRRHAGPRRRRPGPGPLRDEPPPGPGGAPPPP
jgi:hypothetical protein